MPPDDPPNTPAAAVALAERHLQQGEPILAYNAAQDGLAQWPQQLRLRQLQALALARSGDVERANRLLTGLVDEAAKKQPQAALGEQLRSADELIWLAYTLARQGRSDEARGLIGPVLAMQRSLQKRPDNDDVFQRRSLVMALVAAAAAEPAAGKALLDEAQATYARLPAEFRGLNSTAFVSQRLAEARR